MGAKAKAKAKPKQLLTLSLILIGVLLAATLQYGSSQNCCTNYAYCVVDIVDDATSPGAGPVSSVVDTVTPAFFDGIINQSAGNCEGKPFYTRAAFLTASNSYPEFAPADSADQSKREIAAFFAHVTDQTGHLCYINEIDGASHKNCDSSNTQYPCVAGQKYYGRGPLQLSWNYNYGAAGRSIGFDGLNNPGIVASDAVISFKTALWFWMNNVHGVIGQGFGATIRAISGPMDCDGGNPMAVTALVGYYRDYCTQFGVPPGDILTC